MYITRRGARGLRGPRALLGYYCGENRPTAASSIRVATRLTTVRLPCPEYETGGHEALAQKRDESRHRPPCRGQARAHCPNNRLEFGLSRPNKAGCDRLKTEFFNSLEAVTPVRIS